jgi:hypothetical protein
LLGSGGIASSGAIATWAVVQSHPLIWGAIIAITQVADAVKDEFPLTSRLNAASATLTSFDALFIEADFEWASIFSGQFSNAEIMKRCRKLKQLRHGATIQSRMSAARDTDVVGSLRMRAFRYQSSEPSSGGLTARVICLDRNTGATYRSLYYGVQNYCM